MALLEEITPGVLVKGLLPNGTVTIISVKRHGSIGVELVYQDANGHLGSELLYSDNMANLEIVPAGLPWSFDADGALFRLASEAYRIRLAYLFDPLIAVHTSLIEPLPHQITAVYETMLTKQPLRYLLADDPGAGKTIMTGLLIKELMIRGDLRRCLVVAPGNLVEQWQDELSQRFSLVFDILTNDRLEASASGNAFGEMPLCIARLDKLSRDADVQEKLRQTEWDVIVVDEAHKMSATFFGGEAKYTRRYRLGELLGKITRHLVLLTATPHNGKEEDFQLFMRLLDADRFEGKFRDGVHSVDVSDLVRHLVKEQLYTFESTPLFPERFAYTVNYQLSGLEDSLYHAVTGYVRQEFNRAEALDTGRKGTVGFALTTLQRRLASSPEAIYQSIKRRRERLERRLQEARQETGTSIDLLAGLPALTGDDLEDLDDAPGAEVEETEERVVDSASAALTITELEIEIRLLAQLEALAQQVRRSGTDRKWESLASLLQNNAEMFDAQGQRRKLVIFTEHRDTLRYLAERIRTMLGCDEAVATIHGGIHREERARAQESFTQEKQVQVLLATDAAGEGINLQRAHLMVNYDLPWNPNRIEQRFGRIHRIGQQEVCHLWNLVASETREGEVYHTLLKKLEEERNALGGQVFNVLGEVFDQCPLRDLIVEAIRYGDRPDVRAKLTQVVDQALDRAHLQALLEERALTHEVMDVVRVRQVREEMERAAARRLQPHFIAAFFLEAFRRLGGKYYEREPQRYEITHVPAVIRNRVPRSQARAIILQRYERIVFEKERITVEGKPQAALICPGHPLLDATLDLVLEQQRDLLTQGTILVNPTDMSDDLRVLFYLEHTIQDASTGSTGKRREVSRQLQFLEMDAQGCMRGAGYAPFLDYRPLREEEQAFTPQLRAASWLQGDLEEQARSYAITELVPRHLAEVRKVREAQIDKTSAAVNDRLTREISYWDNRAAILKAQEAAGKTNARQNSQMARSRAEELYGRLERRLNELEQERKLSPLPPVVVGGVLVVPQGLLNRLAGQSDASDSDRFARETARIEGIAMEAIMQRERSLGYVPRDVSADKCGYDIESRVPNSGKLRFIEVKGRVQGSETITVTRNEILTALNKPDDFILALVLVDDEATTIHYIPRPFHAEPDFGATSVNYEIEKWPHPLAPSPSKMERGEGGEARRALCRELRQQQTPAEEFFWELLRDRRFEGYKFRRQHPLSRFIADFYCPELRLAVELDGGIHAMQVERDRARDEILAQHDIRVVRIRNEGFLADPEITLAQLSDLIAHWTTQDEVASAPTPTHADAQAYADAEATYLALAVDRSVDRNSTICSWDSSPKMEALRNTFARQAIPMIWDFAEGNPFSASSGNWMNNVEWVSMVIDRARSSVCGYTSQHDAMAPINVTAPSLISTDPPYYDNIGYADLADFFYVWLRRSLGTIYPDLFKTMLVPKTQELVATPYRFGGSKNRAQEFFETGLGKAFERMRATQHPDYPLTVYYAFKQAESEAEGDEGDEASNNGSSSKVTASTGWETMLEGLIRAGFSITGTWPMRTEMKTRQVAMGTNALASSIVIVCRPRTLDAPIASRRQFLNALRAELPAALNKLQHGSIAPVDLAQASIGPGMAIYSRYSKVVESDGTPLRVRTALQLINRALDEALAEQEGEYDAETRWAVAWFEQYAMNAGEYGVAETLSKAKNTTVQSLVDAGLLEARAGKVRLLKREELPEAWNPKASRLTVWEVMQRMIHELLDGKGDVGAGDILRKASAQGEAARDLAYRLYTVCERKGWAQEALAYNSLVTSWLEISRLAHREAADGSLWGATFLG